jgi:hypothetical protein
MVRTSVASLYTPSSRLLVTTDQAPVADAVVWAINRSFANTFTILPTSTYPDNSGHRTLVIQSFWLTPLSESPNTMAVRLCYSPVSSDPLQ